MHLAPVCVDHVGCCRHSGELLNSAITSRPENPVPRAAWVFTVSKTFFELWCDLQCFFEAPAAVRVEVNSCIRECFFDRLNCFEFFLRCKYAAFEFEIYEAVFFMVAFASATIASGVRASSWRRRYQSHSASGSSSYGRSVFLRSPM